MDEIKISWLHALIIAIVGVDISHGKAAIALARSDGVIVAFGEAE